MWKTNFEGYLDELKPDFKWVEYLSLTYKNYANLPRAEYLREANSIRYESFHQIPPEFGNSKVVNF